jgi:hypothetical protein
MFVFSRFDKSVPMAPAPITRWRIHIGAHKTATTHAQETLAALRPVLVAGGVDFVPNRELRAGGVAVALTRRRPEARIPILRGRMVRRALAERLDPLRAGPTTLVLSEEKLLGGSQHVFADPIYPQLERTVRLLATLATRAEVTFFLSIRSFDTQLPSAYVQELKYMTPPPGGFEAIRRRALARPPSWFDLVCRLRAAAPGIPLRIWRQEDYRANTRAILSALCGIDVGPPPEVADPAWTRSPDLAAIRAAEALPRDMPDRIRKAEVRAIFAAGGDGERFQPFAAAERAALRAAYAADLARIAELDPEMLIRF